MISGFSFRRCLHLFIGAGLGCAFVGVSVPRIWPAFAAKPVGNIQPFHSTDAYLGTLLGRPHASLVIQRALASLPANKGIVLIMPDESVLSAFVAQNVRYLSWPRELQWLPASAGEVEQKLKAVDPEKFGGVIFWEVTPPANMPRGVAFGARQILVPLPHSEAASL